jgi:hypothetical protein
VRRIRTSRGRAATFAVAALLLAGCGSTVQTAPGSATTGDALAVPGSSSASGSVGATSGLAGSASDPSVGAGSSGSASTSSGTSVTVPGSTGGAASQPATGANVASASGPIKIGFIVTNASNAGDFGVSSGQTFSDQQLYDALVAAMNKRGGINGRKIEPVYGVTDTAAPDWSTQFQAACAKFTQDNHVAAVLGYIFVFMDSFESCLARAGVPHLYGGYQPGDTTQQRHYPTLVATTAPTSDVHWQIALSGAVTSGLLTPKSKLGLLVDSCANDDKAFSRVGAPYLKAHHIHTRHSSAAAAPVRATTGPPCRRFRARSCGSARMVTTQSSSRVCPHWCSRRTPSRSTGIRPT